MPPSKIQPQRRFFTKPLFSVCQDRVPYSTWASRWFCPRKTWSSAAPFHPSGRDCPEQPASRQLLPTPWLAAFLVLRDPRIGADNISTGFRRLARERPHTGAFDSFRNESKKFLTKFSGRPSASSRPHIGEACRPTTPTDEPSDWRSATRRDRSARARRRPVAPKIVVIEQRMTSPIQSFTHLSDDELLATVKRLATTECRATAALVQSLMELDVRRLYLGEGYSSLFTYCTQALHLAEGAAYNRIEAARAARRFPTILARGRIGDADHRPAVGATLDSAKSSARARVGTAHGEAGGRGTRRIASSLTGSSVNDPKVARPSTGPAGYEPRRTPANINSAELACGHAVDQDGAATDGGSPGAGALQTAVHDLARDAGEASPRAGPRAPCHSIRRFGRDLRSCAHTPAAVPGASPLRSGDIATRTARGSRRLPAYPRISETRGLAARYGLFRKPLGDCRYKSPRLGVDSSAVMV